MTTWARIPILASQYHHDDLYLRICHRSRGTPRWSIGLFPFSVGRRSSATQTETITVIVYQHYPDQYATYTVSGTFTSPFLDLYPNPYYGSGDSVIIFPGDWAVASLNYAPIWPGVDTTVDVELRRH